MKVEELIPATQANIELAHSLPVPWGGAAIPIFITGSCMIAHDAPISFTPTDFDWFVPKRNMIPIVACMLMDRGFELDGTQHSLEGEKRKLKWSILPYNERKFSWLNSISLIKGDMIINITHKEHCDSVLRVIDSFDMSAVMIAYDTASRKIFDGRTLLSDDPHIAVPNVHGLRVDFEDTTVSWWLRQDDRVRKYWDRGINTLAVSEYYEQILRETLEIGNVFDSDRSKERYEEITKDWYDQLDRIVKWNEAKRKEIE